MSSSGIQMVSWGVWGCLKVDGGSEDYGMVVVSGVVV